MANRLFKSLSKMNLLENSAYDKDSNTLFISNPGISYDVLKGLAKRHGFAIGKTKSGNFVSIPLSQKYNYDDNGYVGLYDSFMETYTYYSKNYANLLAAYKTFDLMDENLAEVGLILDTYTAEVLAQGFVDNPLKISISDSKAQRIVEKILYKNKIYQRLPNITRSIAKYGNYGLILHYPYLNQWLSDNKNVDFNQIDVVEDLSIRFVNPKYFKINTDEYMNVINYETTEENNYVAKPKTTAAAVNEIWQPWQFVHFAIRDEATEPYGKSMLWSMRSAFDQLSTLEALLGISRASKIQRLVFYIPIPNGTALTDAYGYMNEFKTQYLNSIFTDAPGAKAGRKIPGATSILTLPVAADGKKVEVDHIEANIDLSSTEDVDYFKDKIYNNSKLPKGYLVVKGKNMIYPEEKNIKYPVIVKPNNGGIGLGISVVSDKSSYEKALKEAFKWESDIIVEEYVSGREFAVSILDKKVLPIVEVLPLNTNNESFGLSVTGERTKKCPASISAELEKKLKDAALTVSNSLDLDTYAKVDFILRKDNTFVCLECDSQPRLNSDSHIILSSQNANLSFTDFCKKVLEMSYFNK